MQSSYRYRQDCALGNDSVASAPHQKPVEATKNSDNGPGKLFPSKQAAVFWTDCSRFITISAVPASCSRRAAIVGTLGTHLTSMRPLSSLTTAISDWLPMLIRRSGLSWQSKTFYGRLLSLTWWHSAAQRKSISRTSAGQPHRTTKITTYNLKTSSLFNRSTNWFFARKSSLKWLFCWPVPYRYGSTCGICGIAVLSPNTAARSIDVGRLSHWVRSLHCQCQP